MSDCQDLPREARELITLARQWIPYGGVPAELVFQTFGITEHQFVDRLWAVVQDTCCDPHLVRALSSTYPRRRSHWGVSTTRGRSPV